MDQGTQHTLTVTSHDIAGITVVKMQGSLASTTAEHGNEEMKKILEKGSKKVVINLANLDYMSSAGVRVVLLTCKLLDNAPVGLMISESNAVVREVLERSMAYGFAPMIHLFNTDEEAMAAFKG